jgi:RNA polymerase sigma factor (sigma-70 family)
MPHSDTSLPHRTPVQRSDPRASAAEPLAAEAPAGPDRMSRLLDQARGGLDRASLNAVVAELSPMLWQVARAQGLDRDTAEDVVQTTWLSLLRHLDGIRSSAALTGWLVTVTKREAWRVRRNGRGERSMDDWTEASLPDPGPLPEEQLLADDRRRMLWRAVRKLSPRCQELLRVVAFVRRPDYTELSESLGMPLGSIGPTRGRCLAKLRQLLTSDPSWSSL